MSKKVKRKVYLDRDAYKVRLEEITHNGIKLVFVHVEVKEALAPSIIKELRKEFKILKLKVARAKYDYIHSYSATPKFYRMFKGAEDIGEMVWEGEKYRVLRWELNY